jgi:hypothetical protein
MDGTSCLARSLACRDLWELVAARADMPHDSADRAGREAARDRGGVGPQEAQPAATCQEAEAVEK